MKNCFQALILTSRDREVLRFIGQGGIATLDQLHRHFWPGAKLQTCQARLTQLRRVGWLAQERLDLRQRGALAFTLTRAGAEQFSRGEYQRFMIGRPAQAELKQQLLLQEARIILEREFKEQGQRMVDWKSERELRQEQQRKLHQDNHSSFRKGHREKGFRSKTKEDIADALITVADQEGKEYQLELEADGAYFGQMLRNKVKALQHNPHPVIWITTPQRAERIKQEIENYDNLRLMVVGAKAQ